MNTKLYQQISQTVGARENCIKSNNPWADRHEETLNELNSLLPSGSGIDSGTKLDVTYSTPNKLIFDFSYHHMNDGGFYDGWTDHRLIVTPSLSRGFDLRITGRNRNDVKDYLYEVFANALNETIDFDNETKKYFVPAWRDAAAKFQQNERLIP